MATFNTIKGRNLGNTATDGTGFLAAMSLGGYLAPFGNHIISAENLANLATWLPAQLRHDDPLKRWQKVGPWEDFADQSEDPTVQTLGNGRKMITDDGKTAWQFQFINGGHHMAAQLRGYNNLHELYRYFDVDIENNITGFNSYDATTGAKQMEGLTLSMLYTRAMKAATKSSVADFRIDIGFEDQTELNENRYSFRLPDTLKFRTLKGVAELTLEDLTPSGAAAGVFTVGVYTGSGNKNLAEDATLSAAIAASGMWELYRTDTGVIVPTTGVAVNGTKTGFVITANTAHANYVATKQVAIRPTAVSVWAAAGLKWFATSNPNKIIKTLTAP